MSNKSLDADLKLLKELAESVCNIICNYDRHNPFQIRHLAKTHFAQWPHLLPHRPLRLSPLPNSLSKLPNSFQGKIFMFQCFPNFPRPDTSSQKGKFLLLTMKHVSDAELFLVYILFLVESNNIEISSISHIYKIFLYL